jgi:small subunit ribosomal protein S20
LADHKSAVKRHKQSLVRRERNRIVKSTLKTVAKKVESAVAEKEKDAADTLKAAVIALDRAARKGVIHKKTAARKKSRLTKKVNALSA